MTSKLTREERVQALYDLKVGQVLSLADIENVKMLSRMALAAMSSEPVAEVVSIYGDPEAFGEREIRPLVGIQQMPYGTKLYRHAQPAPVVPEEKAYPKGKPISDYQMGLEIGRADGWNACRAAMLQELQKSAGAEATCRSNKNAQVLHTKSPAQSDCCPAQNGDTPAQSQRWIPVSERMPIDFEAVIAFDGDQVYGEAMYSSDDGFTIDGYEPCDRLKLQNVTHWMPLPSAPHEVNQ